MLEQTQIAEQFLALLEMEKQAHQMYFDLATRLTDPEALKQVRQLLHDKQRHIQLIQRLLEIVEQ